MASTKTPRRSKAAANVFIGLASKALPAITPESVAVSRFLNDVRLGAALSGVGIELTLLNTPPDAQETFYKLQFECVGEAIEVHVARVIHPIFGMATSDECNAALTSLACQVVWRQCAAVLDRIGLQLPVDPLNLEVAVAPEAAVWFSIRDAAGSIAIFSLNRLPTTAEMPIRNWLHSQVSHSAQKAAWTLVGAVVIHQQSLSLGLLETLQVGDMVVLPQVHKSWRVGITWGAPGGVQANTFGKLEQQQITVEGPLTMQKQDADSEDIPAPTEGIGDLEVPVRFELDTVAISIKELEAIGPGYVIELTKSIDAAVIRLVSFGQTIGQAELVAVGDRIGVRITRMTGK